ncbi:MAG: Ras- protein rsr1 [Sclerophora amabilis]|nr:MAG: Ras- protein rsr1 [Sclerophora amabilis]
MDTGGVGKSCLTAQFVQNVWIESYDPTIEDSYRKQIEVEGRQCMLEIHGGNRTIHGHAVDTPSTFHQNQARRTLTQNSHDGSELYMKSGQGFLLVFSITSPSSLAELAELREQIIRIKDDERVPIVIVGNKSDLEEDRAVSRARAFSVSQSWGAGCPYYETSARRRTNVDEVFVDLCSQIVKREGGGTADGNVVRRYMSGPPQQQGSRRYRQSSHASTVASISHTRRRRTGRRRRNSGGGTGTGGCTIL